MIDENTSRQEGRRWVNPSPSVAKKGPIILQNIIFSSLFPVKFRQSFWQVTENSNHPLWLESKWYNKVRYLCQIIIIIQPMSPRVFSYNYCNNTKIQWPKKKTAMKHGLGMPIIINIQWTLEAVLWQLPINMSYIYIYIFSDIPTNYKNIYITENVSWIPWKTKNQRDVAL